MSGAALSDSAIVDEVAHIPSGYAYVKYFDYRLNPEHPPLVKILAGLPLLFKDLNFPLDKPSWTTDVNGQWDAGRQFLYESGNNADEILFLARLGPIILTLLLIILVYVFSKELVGRWWALLPTFFTALSPHFLAHGHYVTTDIGATLGILLATYFFLKYLFHPSRTNLVLAGLAFGAAQLLKFSAVILGPYFLVIIIIFSLIKKGFWKNLWSLLLIFVIGFLLIYAFYFITTWGYPIERQVSDTGHILQSFGFRPVANLNIWMAGNQILRPWAEYFLGVLMVLQRSAGGNTGYFLGEVSATGWHYYFPTVFVMKEPLAILIIIALALFFSSLNILRGFKDGLKNAVKKFKEYLNTHFAEFAILLFVILYWAQSIQSTLNIGFRHLIPTLPFIYMLAAGSIKKWVALTPHALPANLLEKLSNVMHRFLNLAVKSVFLALLLLWLAITTVISSPHFLSSFNELFGGSDGGYKYVTDSNFDWGQDLKRLQKWTKENLGPEEKIAVDYFGGGSPGYYLGNHVEYWWSARGNPKEEGINWLAVSINTIQSATAMTAPGFIRNPVDEYRWLNNPLSPHDRAGTSIFIYKL